MRPVVGMDCRRQTRRWARRDGTRMTTTGSKTIFVTGATGLVGSHAVEEALRRGHRVRALVRASSDTRRLDAWGVEKVPGDLADAEALRRGVASADWVFNCA